MRYYIKATLKGGRSKYDNDFVYHIGLNTHPKPDRGPTHCGEGIHLAKSISAARKYCPGAEEYYLATTDDFIAIDDDKVRCGSCTIIKQLSETDIKEYDKLSSVLCILNPLCGEDWLEQHAFDVSWDDYYNQKMELVSQGGKHKTTITARVTSKKQLKASMKSHS